MSLDAKSSTGRLSAACRRTLLAWVPPSEEQAALRQDYLRHLERQPDGWHRRCLGQHLTASALVCVPDPGRVLLTLHAKLGRWLQTGGHLEADDDDSLESAALREATEESGMSWLRLDPPALLLSRHRLSCGGRLAYHLDVQFLVLAPSVLTPTVSEESLAVDWFAPDALPEVDDSVRALVSSAGRRLGWTSSPMPT